ncbi:5859_t:CDS:1, partial [Scutellospora calospora]
FNYNITLIHYQSSQTVSNISLEEFFTELDQIHNSNRRYIALKESFEYEEIAVDTIKNLPDNYLDELGIHKMG